MLYWYGSNIVIAVVCEPAFVYIFSILIPVYFNYLSSSSGFVFFVDGAKLIGAGLFF